MYCKVCNKEIPENEYGTCEECHKEILIRLEEKKQDTKVIKYCSKCGKEIEEEWEYCNYCGKKIKEDVTFGEYRNSDSDDISNSTKIHYSKKNKNPIFFSCVIVLFLILMIFFIFYNIKNKEKKYNDLMINTAQKMYVVEAVTELHYSYIISIWYNAIFEERDYLTDPYTFVDESGYGVKMWQDFQKAINNYLTTNKDSINKLNEYKDELQNSMKDLQNMPNSKYSESLQTLQSMYQNFISLLDLVNVPTGNYRAYGEKCNSYIEEFKSEYEKLIIIVPEIKDFDFDKEKENLLK